MPKTIQTTVPVQNVKKGDVIVVTFGTGTNMRTERNIADTIKIGTKWVEVRNAEGKLLARYESGMGVQVEREVPTDEELAERRTEQMMFHLDYEMNSVKGDPQSVLDKMAEKLADGSGISHWEMDRLLSANAEYKLQQVISYCRAQALKVHDATDAVSVATMVRETVTRRRYTNNPLSRSTSTTSNLEEDLDNYMVEQLLEKLNRYRDQLDTRYAEMVAVMDARRAAEKAAELESATN